jgi:hypothetical protein
VGRHIASAPAPASFGRSASDVPQRARRGRAGRPRPGSSIRRNSRRCVTPPCFTCSGCDPVPSGSRPTCYPPTQASEVTANKERGDGTAYAWPFWPESLPTLPRRERLRLDDRREAVDPPTQQGRPGFRAKNFSTCARSPTARGSPMQANTPWSMLPSGDRALRPPLRSLEALTCLRATRRLIGLAHVRQPGCLTALATDYRWSNHVDSAESFISNSTREC